MTMLTQLTVLGPTLPYPPPPCEHCTAVCCRKGSFRHNYAVELSVTEREDYAEARRYREYGKYVWGVRYNSCGVCAYLRDDHKCDIYSDRPTGCQEFNCLHYYGQGINGEHMGFLRTQSDVVHIIEQHRPDFVEWVKQRNAAIMRQEIPP